jgi:hypothetical protein
MDNASFSVKSGHAVFEFFGSLFLGQEAKTVNSPRNFRKPTPARAPALVGSGIGRLLLMCVIILALAASASNGKIAFKSGRNNTIGIRVKNPDGTVLIRVL